jgi:hypothetical protein
MGFILLWYFSKFAISLWIGATIWRHLGLRSTSGYNFLLGIVTWHLLLLVPVVDPLVRMFGLMFGMGTLILVIQKIYTKSRNAQMI